VNAPTGRPRLAAAFLCGLVALARAGWSQIIDYPDPTLHYLYPSGGQRGQTVQVEMGPLASLEGAGEVVIDGPPGVTATDLRRVGDVFQATFHIAADAPPGRRLVRVRGGGGGLTSGRPFFVGTLPETAESEPNETPQAAQLVQTPLVINGRIHPSVDVDCFAFEARSGASLVAAVLAHGMDVKEDGSRGGFLDLSLEVLDAQNNVVAASEDAVGLDPLVHWTVSATGRYTLRLRSLGYKGSPSSVYRVTSGEMPYATATFPAGGQRGTEVAVEFFGPNVPRGKRQLVHLAAGAGPILELPYDPPLSDGHGPAFVVGGLAELAETEPNGAADSAMVLNVPGEGSGGTRAAGAAPAEAAAHGGEGEPGYTVNARFDLPGDEDWYRFTLAEGQDLVLHTLAQRYLFSPVDTVLEVYDDAGRLLAENDDGTLWANECTHDFASADSWLAFRAARPGQYFVRVRDQSGAAGARAMYRLTVQPLQPDFVLHQWPDAVPIWGPGTTAAFVVQLMHWGGLDADVVLRVEGLPDGWIGSTGIVPASSFQQLPPPYGTKALLTITAPADAPLGAMAEFRVIGRADAGGRIIEHTAQALTLLGNAHNDRMHLRPSPVARAVVAPPLDSWLETPVHEVEVRRGQTVEIPVTLHRRPGGQQAIGVVVNGQTPGAGCGWSAPITLAADQTELRVPLAITEQQPGTYGIVVARSWASDLRVGRPGPCTPLMRLRILPAE
jgi:hypothetical protein